MPANADRLFSREDIESAILQCDFRKSIGPDGFDGSIIVKNEYIKAKVCEDLANALNERVIPEHILIDRYTPVSKNSSHTS